MKFCISTVKHWNEMGIDVSNCRRSLDNQKALVHYDLAKVYKPSIDTDFYVTTYEQNDVALAQELARGWLEDPATKEQLIMSKIEKLRLTCQYSIVNEFYSRCLGERKRFDCEITDQLNILGLVGKAQLMMISPTLTDNIIEWKASGEPTCYPWTPQQVIQLGIDMYGHVSNNIKRFEELRMYVVDPRRTIEEIEAVDWRFDIPIE